MLFFCPNGYTKASALMYGLLLANVEENLLDFKYIAVPLRTVAASSLFKAFLLHDFCPLVEAGGTA